MMSTGLSHLSCPEENEIIFNPHHKIRNLRMKTGATGTIQGTNSSTKEAVDRNIRCECCGKGHDVRPVSQEMGHLVRVQIGRSQG